MNAIVCVDKNWGIGKDGNLLFRIPADMSNFVLNTLGKPVIMGLNTLHSLPGGRPLQKRLNIVLAPEGTDLPEGVIHVTSIENLFEYLKKSQLLEDQAMVIGGGMVYNTLLPYCKYVFVTQVDADGEADTFIRDLSHLDQGFLVLYQTPFETHMMKKDDREYPISMRYIVYENMQQKELL